MTDSGSMDTMNDSLFLEHFSKSINRSEKSPGGVDGNRANVAFRQKIVPVDNSRIVH